MLPSVLSVQKYLSAEKDVRTFNMSTHNNSSRICILIDTTAVQSRHLLEYYHTCDYVAGRAGLNQNALFTHPNPRCKKQQRRGQLKDKFGLEAALTRAVFQ